MRPPRVAYVLKMFPRFSETFILAELLELQRQGVEVVVFSLRPPVDRHTHADLNRSMAAVHYVPRPSWAAAAALLSSHLRIAGRNPLRYLRALGLAIASLRRTHLKHFAQAGWIAPRLEAAEIEHVHAHFASSPTSVALHLKRLTGVSYSFTAHAKDIYLDTVRPQTLVQKLREARFVATVSDYNIRRLTTLHATTRVVRIYNGLDLDQFARRRGARAQPPLILAVGRLVEKKGFDDLVRAAAVLHDRGVAFRCSIVGIGAQRDALARIIDKLGLTGQVALTGPLPRERLIELLPSAFVLAAPCVIATDGNRDGLPTVLVEAMALGVPVVATDVTGIPELVHHEVTGLLVPPRDPRTLASALQRLLSDRVLAERLADEARRLIEKQFDLRANVAELRGWLIGNGSARRMESAPDARRDVAA